MKSFYIGLAKDAPNQSLAALFNHALSQLKEDTQNKPFDLAHFELVNPYTENDTPSVFVAYDFLTQSETRNRLAAMTMRKN
jgi:hypothetical protein